MVTESGELVSVPILYKKHVSGYSGYVPELGEYTQSNIGDSNIEEAAFVESEKGDMFIVTNEKIYHITKNS